MARIELRNLTRTFAPGTAQARIAVDNLTLEIADGEWLALAGPSGCGKTTTLRLIAGLEQPDAGEVLVNGRSQHGLPPEARNIAMVFQDPALYPHMTVEQNLGFGLKLRGCPAAERRERVTWAATLLGISDSLQRRPAELSGGQRQRVAIGRALVRRPVAFLLDEPLGSLDAPTREQLRRELRQVLGEARATVLYVTHDQSEAMAVGHRIAIMNQGRLQQTGEPLSVYTHPANLFVARFLGSPGMNLCKGTLGQNSTGLNFQASGWSFPIEGLTERDVTNLTGRPLVAGIRPEAVVACQEQTRRETIEATVEGVEHLGGEQRIYLRMCDDRLVARSSSWGNPKPGEPVRIRFTPGCLRLFDAETGELLK